MPDCIKLAVIQRRHAGRGLFQKTLVGFFRIAVFLYDDTGKAGHGSVAASFRDHDVFFMPAGQVCIELIVIQKFREVHATGIELHIRLLCSEEETSSIQSLRIEIWKYGIDQLLHIAIEGSIRYPVDGKEHMELWPCRFAVFLALIKAAVMDGEAYSRKCLQHVCRCDPVFRIF